MEKILEEVSNNTLNEVKSMEGLIGKRSGMEVDCGRSWFRGIKSGSEEKDCSVDMLLICWKKLESVGMCSWIKAALKSIVSTTWEFVVKKGS